MLYRFTLQSSVGGFELEEVSLMEHVVIEDRGNLRVPLPFREQIQHVRRACIAFLDSLHHPITQHQFGRNMMMEESFANLEIHGNQGNATLLSGIRLTVDQCRDALEGYLSCVLQLDDHSPCFDTGKVPDPSDEPNLERPTGRGLLLIREIGHATILQTPRPGGKTMIYSWKENSRPPEPEEADESS
jgi:hypothetical protein